MMNSNRHEREGEEDGTRIKRQRQATREESETSEQVRDYYDDVFEGRLNGMVLNSWLWDTRPLYTTHYDAMMDSTAPAALSLSIRSLNQQLLQVKRKLWPAAESCAKAIGAQSSPQHEFAQARRWCNPMEPLGEGKARGLNQMFMNRSAIKLANIDAMLDFGFTQRCVVGHEPFLFVDLCGAPGGFSEYLMMRCESTKAVGSCRGYGMSLIGTNEHGKGTPWKLDHISFLNGSFQTNYRVCTGSDEKGDIYSWGNVERLSEEIQSDLQSLGATTSSKVHLVVADGGFDAQRDSECQEELAQKLVLCEMAAGIYLLRVGGTMVVKMFGSQTASIRTALHSMFDMFEELQILKPISSRPASSERYVLFLGFRGLPSDWNGPSWLSQVLLGTAAAGPPSKYVDLHLFLDQMEMDILVLNLKACFAILSSLDRKSALSHSGQPDEGSWAEERPPVNVNAYKTAWQLY
jgi:cap1 methyltransferase